MTTILVVDDSKLARIVVARAIAALQPEWKRLEASNAEQAMELIEKQKVDVALVDYNMPGKNGLELAAEIRTLHPSMPIAVITANVQDEIVAAARAINASFVSKPVTEEGLRGFLSSASASVRLGSK